MADGRRATYIDVHTCIDERSCPVKKVVLLSLLLLTVGATSAVACYIDILNEYVDAFYVGVPGSTQLQVYGGTPGYTFTIYSGSLPPGVTLSSSGLISGTPTSSGYWTVCIRVTDSTGCHSTRCYEIYVF
jgi:hypothetical protein